MVERVTAALRVLGLIFARSKYLYSLQVLVAGLAFCICDFSMYVNAPKKQELFLERGND